MNKKKELSLALIGNPNTGKSTLFNLLTGLKQKTANYPGVTVEKRIGRFDIKDHAIHLTDLPGCYSLSPESPDELVAAKALYGDLEDVKKPDGFIVAVDSTNLRRNLFLATQLSESKIPVIVVLTMWDVAKKIGTTIDLEKLSQLLKTRVTPMEAHTGEGLSELIEAIDQMISEQLIADPNNYFPEIDEAVKFFSETLDPKNTLSRIEIMRALIDQNGYAEQRLESKLNLASNQQLEDIRHRFFDQESLFIKESRSRYKKINAIVKQVEQRNPIHRTWVEKITNFIDQPVIGLVLFIAVLALVFQAVFSWATPMMEGIDILASKSSLWLKSILEPTAFRSLLTDGVIAGVGSVVIFLPQILILFCFIIVLEDSGYLSRTAFIMEKIMRNFGLSGKSVIPLISSFACAVPGIMATRVIPEPKARLITILSAPFMTCSARLPVYALLIGAFIPDTYYMNGWINLKGLVLLGLYFLGIFGGIFTALIMKTFLPTETSSNFIIELFPYRTPNLKSMLIKLYDRALIFLKRAGTVIFSVAILIWALAYFPRPIEIKNQFDIERDLVAAVADAKEKTAQIIQINQEEKAAYLEHSWLGQMGKSLAPVFKPLGWDWKVTAAFIGGIPAREVVIAALGTIYAIGDATTSESLLQDKLKNAFWDDGKPIFTLPMTLGLLVFYAFCLQCFATIAIIRRETNSWRWPIIAWTYMTSLSYLAALITHRLVSLII